MNSAYLHLAGGCCAHNVVVVQLKSQNVITIPALKYCALIKYFENPVNTWMKRMNGNGLGDVSNIIFNDCHLTF